jgi:chemotaxis protein MotB
MARLFFRPLARPLVLALALTGPLGCVKKADHEAVLTQLDTTKQDLVNAQQQLQAETDARAAERAAAQAESRDLQQQIAELQARLVHAEEVRADLEGRLAKVIKDRSSLEGSVAEMQKALFELQKRKLAAEQRIAAYNDLLARFRPLIDSGKLQVKIIDGRMVVQLRTDILFASGSAELSEAGTTAIREVAAILIELPTKRFQIEGHTDDVPIKTARFPSNWELASARAIRVVTTMIAAGMPAVRVSAAGYAETRPATPNTSDEARAANRRIEIVVVPDLSELPGAEELEALAGKA